MIKPLLHIFRLSLEKGVVPDNLNIVKVTPIFKVVDANDFSNYIQISVLLCFSKMLKRNIYKRTFNHLSKHNVLYRKQFGFQQGLSTKHAVNGTKYSRMDHVKFVEGSL